MAREPMTIEQVQHWVVTLLILAVATFPLGALTAAVISLDADRHGDAIVLTVMMAIIGLLAMTAIRLFHKTRPLSPWLLLGLIPSLLVAIIVL